MDSINTMDNINTTCFVCPITNKIYMDPVSASDGYVYERVVAQNLINTKTKSPVSNQIIKKEIYPLLFLVNEIKTYLENNPEYKLNQYKPHYNDNIIAIKRIIRKKNYEQLKSYVNFDIGSMFRNNILENVLQNASDSVLTYLFYNSINKDYKYKNNIQIIHLICKYCSEYIILYVFEYNIFDHNVGTKDNVYPIHILCQYSTFKVISCVFEKYNQNNQYDHLETNLGWKPFHYICAYSTFETIEYAIDRGLISYFTKNAPITILDNNKQLSLEEKEYIITRIQYKKLKQSIKHTKNKMYASVRNLNKTPRPQIINPN
jgi:hypothetical protein